MKAVVQRVSDASVEVEDRIVGAIGAGLLILLGVGREDEPEQVAPFAQRIVALRIFEDAQGRMQRSLRDVRGAALVVSQFTLYADLTRGNRPGFTPAAPPERAEPLYQAFLDAMRAEGTQVASGVFGAQMAVRSTNQGPVTIVLDDRR